MLVKLRKEKICSQKDAYSFSVYDYSHLTTAERLNRFSTVSFVKVKQRIIGLKLTNILRLKENISKKSKNNIEVFLLLKQI